MLSGISFLCSCVILCLFWNSANGRSVENGRILHGNGWERQPVIEIAPNQNLSVQGHPVFSKEFSSVIERNVSQPHQLGISVSANQPAIYLLPPPPIQVTIQQNQQEQQYPLQQQQTLLQQEQQHQIQQQQAQFQQKQQQQTLFEQEQQHQIQQQQAQFQPEQQLQQQQQQAQFKPEQQLQQQAQFQQVFPSIPTTTENYHKNHNYNKQGGFVPIVQVGGNGQHSNNLINKVIKPTENELNPNRLTQNLKNWLSGLNQNATVIPDKDNGISSSSSNRFHTIIQASQTSSNSISNNKNNNITSASISTVSPAPGQKIRRKVNIEKFRECIFFRLCEKSQCFHFGRHGVCTKS